MLPNDPHKTQPLPPLPPVRAPLVGALARPSLARPVTLPLPALVALALGPALLAIAAMLLWGGLARPATPTTLVILTPTPALARGAALGSSLARAIVAYDAPGGADVGALEPGRAYAVAARSGLGWVQIDVALPGESPNLVWVAAADVPEIAGVAGLADMATPAPTTTAQVIYVAAPAEPAAPTQAYILAPATPAPRSVVLREQPTAQPCSLRELGTTLRVCNGVTP